MESLPATEAYAEGDLPRSIRVAIASNHDEMLDGHFGSCERFLIYQVSPDAARLIAVRDALQTFHAEDRNAARAALVADCQILYLQSIGGPAAAKVVRAGVHPVKQPRGARQEKCWLASRNISGRRRRGWLASWACPPPRWPDTSKNSPGGEILKSPRRDTRDFPTRY